METTKKTWLENTLDIIEKKSEKIPKKEYTFYQIDRLKRMVKHVYYYSDSCPECKINMDKINALTSKLDSMFLTVGSRKEYEKKFHDLMLHLQKKHKIYPSRYFVAYYSFISIFFGIFIGWFIGLMEVFSYFKSILLTIVLCLLVGRIIGARRDKKIYDANQFI